MFRNASIILCAVLCLGTPPAAAADNVVLRLPGGRLLHVAEQGELKAESYIPAARETFELVSLSKDQVAVKVPGGRWLTPDVRDGHTPRFDAGPAKPGDRETFELVPVAPGHYALRLRSSAELLIFGQASKPQAKTPPGALPPGTVEIYHIRELPTIIQTALPTAVRSLAAEELVGKEYDKTRTHDIKKSLDLPDPTLKDLKRTKRRQVLGLTEEYRVQAKLDGSPDIRIPAMPMLVGCGEGGACLMLFAIEANLPIQGHVQYKVHDAASASTGYHTAVRFSAVAAVPLEHSGNDITVGSPVVLDLNISLASLKLSNDILDAARRQIERFINYELRRNEGQIRDKANDALKKAISSHEVRIPLIGYLGLL
jgi:hypothetical protein